MAKHAQAAGHDGLIFQNGEYGGTDYLVFEPEQIKSAHQYNARRFVPAPPSRLGITILSLARLTFSDKGRIMPLLTIKIHWRGSVEYLDLDPTLAKPGMMLSSTERWRRDGQSVVYAVLCTSLQKQRGVYEIRLKYGSKENSHLPRHTRNEIAWGETVLRLDLPGRRVLSAYFNDSEIKSNSGLATTCEIVSDDTALEDERIDRKLQTHRALVRKRQSALRNLLLQRDGGCAITGEASEEVVEAAHIINAADRGRATLHNGILLRADLHLLFDAHKLLISPRGAIRVRGVAPLSEYRRFDGAQLQPHVIARIQSALKQRRAAAKRG